MIRFDRPVRQDVRVRKSNCHMGQRGERDSRIEALLCLLFSGETEPPLPGPARSAAFSIYEQAKRRHYTSSGQSRSISSGLLSKRLTRGPRAEGISMMRWGRPSRVRGQPAESLRWGWYGWSWLLVLTEYRSTDGWSGPTAGVKPMQARSTRLQTCHTADSYS